jgi:hypothetical protein
MPSRPMEPRKASILDALLQARQEESLNIVQRPQPKHPHRPQDLFDVLPSQTRTLHTQSTYLWGKGKVPKALHALVLVATSPDLLPEPGIKNNTLRAHSDRAVFRVGKSDIDILTLQLLQSTIGNICERRKCQSPLVKAFYTCNHY